MTKDVVDLGGRNLDSITSLIRIDRRLHLFVGLYVALWFLIYTPSLVTAIRLWSGSEIFRHCFFVIPISAYFIWKRRNEIKIFPLQPTLLPLFLVILVSFIHILGVAGNIQVFSHFAAFTSIPLLFWSIVGNKIALRLFFPLAIICFAIPIGEEAIPYLQAITADGATALLKLTGIPVFRSGLYLEIPEGRFVVAEACSGIKFFITSAFFGTIYAYVSYRSNILIFAFIALSAAVAIIANILRVYAIIAIARYFGMEHASGFDHIVYGWILFVAILLALLGLGELCRKIDRKLSKNKPANLTTDQFSFNLNHKPFIYVSALAIMVIWQLTILSSTQSDKKLNEALLGEHFRKKESNIHWRPEFNTAQQQVLMQGVVDGSSFDFYVAWYPNNTATNELISLENAFFSKDHWSIANQKSVKISNRSESFDAHYLEITTALGRRNSILYWYMLDNVKSSSPLKIKLNQAFSRMLGKPGSGAVIAITIPSEKDRETSINKLQIIYKAISDKLTQAIPLQYN